MAMNKRLYTYTGDQEVHLSGHGHVKPGEQVETDQEINHPLFVEGKAEGKNKADKSNK